MAPIATLKTAFMPALISIFSPLIAALLALAGPAVANSAADSAARGPEAVVLMYHRVGEAQFPSTNVTADQFRAHLDYLAAEQFNVIGLETLLSALEQGQALPPRSIAITFDDGYRSVGEVAHPLLAERGWPYTVMVNTGPVDDGFEGHLSWAEMRAMAAEGARFGNHSHSHEPLFVRAEEETPSAWRARIRDDIQTAQTRLEQELGAAVHSSPAVLAYPYGEYNQSLLELTEALGYIGLGQHSGAIGAQAHRQALPRFPMNERYAAIEGFALKAHSRPLPVVAHQPSDPVRERAQAPRLTVTLAASSDVVPTCFYQGEPLSLTWIEPGERFAVAGEGGLPVGRSRYNCTAPDGEGNFYWFSQLWIYAKAGT